MAVIVFITDARRELTETCAAIRAAGQALGPTRLLVQLRDKEATEDALRESAKVLRVVTREVGALLVINGGAGAQVATAIAHGVGADGAHFPNEGAATLARITDARVRLGSDAFVTTTAHDDDDVRHAVRAGATAVLVSPVFVTPGKGAPRGVGALASARSIVDAARHTPRTLVYALGGVTRDNAAACARAGADGVAAIRALYDGGSLALAAPFGRGGVPRWP